MYQSNAFRRRFAVAYSERAGRGRWRPSQLPTNTSGHLKYDVKMGKQHREIKWSGRSEPRSFQSPCGWIFSQRLSVIGELLEKGWSSGSQATGGRHTQTHAHLHGLKKELKQHLRRQGLKQHTRRHTQTIHVHKARTLRLLSQFDASCLKCCASKSVLLNEFVYFSRSAARVELSYMVRVSVFGLD